MSLSDSTRGCKVTIYFDNTRETDETLGVTADDHIFTFANSPVSTRDMRLIGKTISSIQNFVDPGGGTTTNVQSANHGFVDNQQVTITGTTNYNGTWFITYIDANVYSIPTAFVANDATGTGTAQEFIVNFDLEPISGTLTVNADLPAYDEVEADYYYYIDFDIDILTQNFKTEFPKPIAELDIWGQPHYQVKNNYPHKVTFRVVLTNETQRNLLTKSMFYADYFILMDKNIDNDFGLRAYEGPIWSNEQGSVQKGASYLLPIELMVEQFGAITEGISGIITSTQNPGGGKVNCTSANHGLSEGDTVTITGTTDYNGEFEVSIVDANVFQITDTYVDSQRGRWERDDQIDWSFWKN